MAKSARQAASNVKGGASSSTVPAVDHWQSAIVGHGKSAPDQLLANVDNPKFHPPVQMRALAASIDTVRAFKSVQVNKRTSPEWPDGERGVETLVDGHARVILALRSHVKEIDVEYVDLTPNEERLALLQSDYLAGMAIMEKDGVEALLEQINTDNQDMQALLSTIAAKAGIIDPVNYNELWEGMPEFEQEDNGAYKSITLHFPTAEALAEFSDLLDQEITDKTKSIWYPKKERADLLAAACIDEP